MKIKNLFLLIGTFFLIQANLMAEKNNANHMSGLSREPIHLSTWPNGKKVAVCFIFFVEEWGFGQGPNFRPDMVDRTPDFVNESFRQYGINWGVVRVGRLFKEQEAPISIALNALFPKKHPNVWKTFRSLVPQAPIIAHGINNSSNILPLDEDQKSQEAYIRKTLDMIEQETGVRSHGWSSPNIYANKDTFSAVTAEGIIYSLDGMDSDILSYLNTKSGPLLLIPYPPMTVDMGQYFQRLKQPRDLEQLWIDYVSELAREAETKQTNNATVVAIGLHPFIVGTPDGTAALRRVIENFKKQPQVWLTDVQAVLDAATPSLPTKNNKCKKI